MCSDSSTLRKHTNAWRSLGNVVSSCMDLQVGLIFYFPPNLFKTKLGNGKTISLKAVMKTAQDQGHYPLYVRTFKSEPYYFKFPKCVVRA